MDSTTPAGGPWANMAPPPPPPPPARPPLVRSRTNRKIAGVASGLAAWLGIDPWAVRLILIVLLIPAGLGLLLYLIGWVLMPDAAGGRAHADGLVHRLQNAPPWVPIVLLVAVLLFFFQSWWLGTPLSVFWAIVLIAAGAWLYRNDARRNRSLPVAAPYGPAGPYPPVGPYPPAGPAGPGNSGGEPAGPGTGSALAATTYPAYPGYPGYPTPGSPAGLVAPSGGAPYPPAGSPFPAMGQTEKQTEEQSAGQAQGLASAPVPGSPPGSPPASDSAAASGPGSTSWPGSAGELAWGPGATPALAAQAGGSQVTEPLPATAGGVPAPGSSWPPAAPPWGPGSQQWATPAWGGAGAAGGGGAGEGPFPAGWSQPVPPAKVKQPKERSPLGRVTFAGALVVLGITALIDRLGIAHVPGRLYPALALIVLGIGLLVGAVWGRAKLMILVGLVVVPIALVTNLAFYINHNGSGNEFFYPATTANLPHEYHLGAGQIRLNLTRLVLPPTGTVVARVTVGAGNAQISVPPNVTVDFRGHVGTGVIEFLGVPIRSGVQVTENSLSAGTPGGPMLRLVVHVLSGRIGVSRLQPADESPLPTSPPSPKEPDPGLKGLPATPAVPSPLAPLAPATP